MGAGDVIALSFVLLITVFASAFLWVYGDALYKSLNPELRQKDRLTRLLGSISDDHIAQLKKTINYYGDAVEFPDRLVSKVEQLEKKAQRTKRAFKRYIQKQIDKENVNVKKLNDDYGKEE